MIRPFPTTTSAKTCGRSVAVALLVGLPPSAVRALDSDLFSCTESGRDALARLKVLRFRWLLANLDVPDMRPWELFSRARSVQARLQCVLVDDRMTAEDERKIRHSGATAFGSNDPDLCAVIAQSSRVTVRAGPARAPP
ncbi:MAG TPA: hypothetical protein VHX86_07530 [Tepidisphaeraceae bacterium]|jgi:hypothetical protein|nr:hypothetical protein [Tepidisphaeraceae bacterium]